MDHTKSTAIAPSFDLSHPAYLLVGSADTLLDRATSLLQQHFCASASACGVCGACRKIREQQHEAILWMNPEKQYAVEDLKPIFSTISFALEEDHHFFFVLQKADMLTTACANALLKSLEEPPRGYHFILLAHRTQLILPTIKSRCLITHYHSNTHDEPLAALLPFFTTTSFQDPLAFGKELDLSNPTEWETLTLVDRLIVYWADNYKKSLLEHDAKKIKQAERMMGHLKKALAHPPMPGSSKLFWKNLFLQVKEL